MKQKIDLSGIWRFAFDDGNRICPNAYSDTITLPGTTSQAKKGAENKKREVSYLTDTYFFEGGAWYEKDFVVDEEFALYEAFLTLERTRKTKVYLDGKKIGTCQSLSTPHVFSLGKLDLGAHTIDILVENTNYPTKGGHLTSPDTQTNWNGITGEISITFYPQAYLSDLMLYTNIHAPSVTIKGVLNGIDTAVVKICVLQDILDEDLEPEPLNEESYCISHNFELTYELPDKCALWSEHSPILHQLTISLEKAQSANNLNEYFAEMPYTQAFQQNKNGNYFQTEPNDIYKINFGLREFLPAGDKFTINQNTTFLRGKHEGLIFPLTGAAPTSVEEWLKIMSITKSYGINHYRFHTCCPPEAAFEAADILGIYMAPEVPFWGTLLAPDEEGYVEAEQDFLIEEGMRILKCFGNHPSFVMFSLGNELWGSKERMAEIIRKYKAFDNRHLYSQGANNFQWAPVILPEDDYFCGVRFSKDRLLRGSYAMCDAPQGHVQTCEPSTMIDYDNAIYPKSTANIGGNSDTDISDTSNVSLIEIQYETGVKKVKADLNKEEQLIPSIPVITHEIGQYETFVNFDEINKYTGSIKARNFEVFKERLIESGMYELSERFFRDSGQLAVDCYQEELEAAFRSRYLAGFQILDLQDFSGQGTALVGILDAFRESKGLITADDFKTFCSDAVLLARFKKFQYKSGETFKAHIELAYYRPDNLYGNVLCINVGSQQINVDIKEFEGNYIDICDIEIALPFVDSMTELNFDMEIKHTDIRKSYSIWVYPNKVTPSLDDTSIEFGYQRLLERLNDGESVLYLPHAEDIKNYIKGCYCTDFWCYPMFKSISEWMKKDIPIGTLGLTIRNRHKALDLFPCETYTTKPWWNLIENSKAVVLDTLPKNYFPIVQTIDNFDRNLKLGTIFECKAGNGKLLVCSINFEHIIDKPEARQLLHSLLTYIKSENFTPEHTLTYEELGSIFG